MVFNPYNLYGQFLGKMDPNQTEQENFRKLLRDTGLFMADILYNAIVIIVLVVLIRSFLISPFRVVGSSMVDTLQNKEFILIDKLSYIIGDVNRGDPIVFLPPPTSKDTPKFEEVIKVKSSGVGTLDFSDLSKKKEVSYCDGRVLSHFWFCRVKVRKDDLVYYAPQKEISGSSAKQTMWNLVKSDQVDKAAYKNGQFSFYGEADTTYMLRVYSSKGSEFFVKRIIGVPGDTIKIDNGRVYLKEPNDDDFVQIDESFLNSENLNRTYISQKQRQNVYEVPEGHYFALGDNRNHSNDSRSWLEPITQDAFPFVPAANISGKVLIVLWPLADLRLIKSADF